MQIKSMFLTAVVSATFACGPSATLQRAPAVADAPLSPCPAADGVNTAGWQLVVSRFGDFRFLLPGTATRTYVDRERDGIGETWRSASGIEVSYRIFRDPPPIRRMTSDDLNVQECVESIGGHHAEVQMFFSQSTIVPGQRVLGTWHLGRQALVFSATAPDSARRDELLAVLRSVDFGQ